MNITHAPDFQPGDAITVNHYSDRTTARVIKRTPKSIIVRACKQTLLNGANSGEADALTMVPGGFSAITYGDQRWSVEDDENGVEQKYTLRTLRNGSTVWKLAGWATRSPGGTISEGHHPHYDFSF